PHDQLRALLPRAEERPGVVQSLANALPSIFGSSDDPLENWMRLTKKDPELAAMENLALELRSAEELLGVVRGLPETVREPGPDEQVADLAGVPLLAGKLGVPLLPSTG
ncbi:MAG TPA: hypothetical protein VI197_01920, partial [Polyangiaceae bacterium]